MLTWDDIAVMDEVSLNIALEDLAGRTWTRCTVPGTGQRCYVHRAADGHPTYSTVPHMHSTASWDATMTLALQYGVEYGTMRTALLGGEDAHIKVTGTIVAFPFDAQGPEISGLSADDPQGLRVALCRLALYIATQQAATPAGRA